MQHVLTQRTRFGLLLATAYLALSWAVRVDTRAGRQNASLVYPLDTFSMYADLPEPQQTAILLRDARGNVHRVEDYAAFACEPLAEPLFTQCPTPIRLGHKGDEVLRHVRRHAAPAVDGVPVQLIARSWQLRPGDLPQWQNDCLLARCVVRP